MRQRLNLQFLFEKGGELAGQPRRRTCCAVGHADIVRPQRRKFPQRLLDPFKIYCLLGWKYLQRKYRSLLLK